ncbi:MAG: DUF1294 domain-containing protein, partial [Atopostipes suicloacalis]|nr:DUF1294 domain-containing protein [Atopostipes suicloacalis]
FLYGLDKKRAMKKKKRISEKTLFFISFLFGGIGALFGMKQFHHKTKKLKFKLLVPIAAAITFAGLIFTII